MEEKEIAKVALPRGRNGGAWRYTRVDYEEKIERWRERIWVFSRMHCHGTEILVSRLVSFFYFLL